MALEIVTGIASIKIIAQGIDSVNKLLTAIKDTAHHEQLVALKEALLSAKEEILLMREQAMDLRTRLENKEHLAFDPNIDAYHKTTDGKKDGPFCKTCWDKEGKLLRLNASGWCDGCGIGYGPQYR